MHIHNHKHF